MGQSPNRARKYQVSGLDDIGDVHAFGTDDLERAEEMYELMSEDLENVLLKGPGVDG